jgi:hypothetical protein
MLIFINTKSFLNVFQTYPPIHGWVVDEFRHSETPSPVTCGGAMHPPDESGGSSRLKRVDEAPTLKRVGIIFAFTACSTFLLA